MQTPTEHGTALAEVIELTLAALERVAPDTATLDLCAIAEAIIENAGGADPSWRQPEWRAVYRAAEDGAPRYAEAVRAFELARRLEVAA